MIAATRNICNVMSSMSFQRHQSDTTSITTENFTELPQCFTQKSIYFKQSFHFKFFIIDWIGFSVVHAGTL